MSVPMKKLPGVLSFQRGTVVSDGAFFNRYADGRLEPLQVIRHGIRGTQNVNLVAASAGSTAKSGRREVSNIQTTDSAKLDPAAEFLLVRFDVKFIDLSLLLFACAPSAKDQVEDIRAMRSGIDTFIGKAKEGATALQEIGRRYARNIANARWLWRNRAVAESIQVTVTSGEREIAAFPDALDIPLNAFDNYSVGEQAVAEIIAAGLRGDRTARLSVSAEVRFGVRGAVEVFPSQNYLENKHKGFARPLYTIGAPSGSQEEHTVREMGQAALRDQKVANALRTFDTWYPSYSERGVPIPVEPNGASLDAQEFFRANKESSAFHSLLRISSIDPNSEEGMFLLACLIRGGVYSGDGKESK